MDGFGLWVGDDGFYVEFFMIMSNRWEIFQDSVI